VARVVVVGGGYAGLATAARLAKLGHAVTLVEASSRVGGALGTVSRDGFSWQTGPLTTLLPAVVRDLFRKSGRPVEDELARTGAELVPVPVVREHRFVDESVLRLPAASRAAQVTAYDELSPGLGEAWTTWTDGLAGTWDVLRRHYLERPWDPADLAREASRVLDARAVLSRSLRRAFRDDRLATAAALPAVLDGQDPRDVPAWLGVTAWLEQCFGVWTVTGGMDRLADVLAGRLVTRGVEVLLDSPVADVVLHRGRVRGVALRDGSDLDADVVVSAVDPRRLPALAIHVERTTPALPPLTTHLGVEGPVHGPSGVELDADRPTDLVLHGDPVVVVRPSGRGPAGTTGVTLLSRGRGAEDPVAVAARRGLDLRDRVLTRLDRTPRALVEEWRGSPLGLRYEGRRTVRQRLGPRTPVPGVYAAGAHATPGSGLAFTGLSAALVATEIGPA